MDTPTAFLQRQLAALPPPPSEEIALFLYGRDLRLTDNCALFHALTAYRCVLPLASFNPGPLPEENPHLAPRATFVYQRLCLVKAELERHGSSLLLLPPLPLTQALHMLCQHLPIRALYRNQDYDPAAVAQAAALQKLLQAQGATLHTCTDHLILDKEDILKSDGTPYRIYTPYKQAWKARYTPDLLQPYPATQHLGHLYPTPPLPQPALSHLGFTPVEQHFPPLRLHPDQLRQYAQQRDNMGEEGTTRLGVHLAWGTLSIRRATRFATLYSPAWLDQLIWRNFFIMILAHYPRVVGEPFQKRYSELLWQNDPHLFAAWCAGRTGYPLVDAGMRQLKATGWMHNRARMVTASFLTKLLLVDWRWGEAYFAQYLLDYDLALNNGNWQWVAGTGCDAAPYFRIFNPCRQAEKFDPYGKYQRRWVPEFASPGSLTPVVEYRQARKRALEVYQQSRSQPVF